MLFDIPYLADWKAIGQRRQILVDQRKANENAKRVDFNYCVGQKIMLQKDGTLRKAADRYNGPYVILRYIQTVPYIFSAKHGLKD